jgi:hypothetical protein
VSLDTAVEFAGPPGLPVDSPVGPAPLTVKVKGAVVSVMPLYIIVTDGCRLFVGKGAPDLGKQYCSTTDAADAFPDWASLRLHRALEASRRSGIIMMGDELACSARSGDSLI